MRVIKKVKTFFERNVKMIAAVFALLLLVVVAYTFGHPPQSRAGGLPYWRTFGFAGGWNGHSNYYNWGPDDPNMLTWHYRSTPSGVARYGCFDTYCNSDACVSAGNLTSGNGWVAVIDALTGSIGYVDAVRVDKVNHGRWGPGAYVPSGTQVTLEWACQDFQENIFVQAYYNGCAYDHPALFGYAYNANPSVVVTNNDTGAQIYSGTTLYGSGTAVVTGAPGTTHNFSVSCISGGGTTNGAGTWTATVPVTISGAQLSLTASTPASHVGSSASINWQSLNSIPGTCTVTGTAPWTPWSEIIQQFTASGSFSVPDYATIGGTLAVYLYGASGGGGGGSAGGCSNGTAGGASTPTIFGSATPLTAGAAGGGGAGISGGGNGAVGSAGVASGGDYNATGGGYGGGGGGGGYSCYSSIAGGNGGAGGNAGYVYKAWAAATAGAPAANSNVSVTIGSPGAAGGNGGGGTAGKVIIGRTPVAGTQSTGVFPAIGTYTYTLSCTVPETGAVATKSVSINVTAACPANYVDDGSGNCVCAITGLDGASCVSSCTDPNSHLSGSSCVCNNLYTYNSTYGACYASTLNVSVTPSSVNSGSTSTVSWEAPSTNAGATTVSCSGSCSGGGSTNLASWTNVGTLPASSPRGGNTPIIINGYIYLIGGYDGAAYTGVISRAPLSNPTQWTNVGSLPVPRYFLTPVVAGGYVYLFGGYDGTSYTATILRAPIAGNAFLTAGNWQNVGTAPLSYMTSLAIIGDYMYVFGGLAAGGSTWSNSIWRASSESPTAWVKVGTMPANAPLAYTSAVVAGSNVYLVGGNNGSAYINSIYAAPLSNPTSWSVVGTLPSTLGFSTPIIVGNTMYLVGGYVNGAWSNSVVQHASLASLSTWTTDATVAALGGGANNNGAILVGNTVYIFGGVASPGVWTNAIYSAPISTGLPFSSYTLPPWISDNSWNSGITWPITVNTTYTLQSTLVTSAATSTSAIVSLIVADQCTNFPGTQATVPTNCHSNGDGTCSPNSGYVLGADNASCVSPPTLSAFTASSPRLRQGTGRTTLSWTGANLPTTCSLSATPAVSGLPSSVSSAATSGSVSNVGPINSSTRFTLTCGTAQMTTTVGVYPSIKEI